MTWYIDVALYFWDLLKTWLNTLFITPFQTHDMLWLLVPLWIAWFFAEFFQEKSGTSLGNAMSNAVVILWASIDCTQRTVMLISQGTLTNVLDLVLRFSLITILFTYGAVIMILGWKGHDIIRKIGRSREVTYIFAIFVPVFYNVIPFSVNHLLAAIIFFPLFYFLIELIDHYTPDPEAIKKDKGESSGSSAPKMDTSISDDAFNFPKNL